MRSARLARLFVCLVLDESSLQPLAVAHIGLAPGHVPDMFGVDQADTDAGLFQDLAGRKPVDAGRLHGHGVDAASRQPPGHLPQIRGEGFEASYRLRIAIRRHGHINLRRSYIDARRILLDALHTNAFSEIL
jgi:hypothetical protein